MDSIKQAARDLTDETVDERSRVDIDVFCRHYIWRES